MKSYFMAGVTKPTMTISQEKHSPVASVSIAMTAVCSMDGDALQRVEDDSSLNSIASDINKRKAIDSGHPTVWIVRHSHTIACIFLFILASVVGVAVGFICGDGKYFARAHAANSTNDGLAVHDLVSHADSAIATNGRPPLQGGQPFYGNQELYNAVDDYLAKKNLSYLHEKYGDFELWDVSRVTKMSELFSVQRTPYSYDMNEDVSKWDVGLVKDMSWMFEGCKTFNGDLSNWNVSSVTNMDHMFDSAIIFDCDLSKWDVSKVKKMEYMFGFAAKFNGNVSGWNTSKVRNFVSTFEEAPSFTGIGVGEWDVSSARDMNSMFWLATSFDADLSNWDVSSAEKMDGMFTLAVSFRGEGLKEWNTTAAENMDQMFSGAISFDADVSGWDTSNVKKMGAMFYQAVSFRGLGLNSWVIDANCNVDGMFCQTTIPGSIYIANWTEEKRNAATSCKNAEENRNSKRRRLL